MNSRDLHVLFWYHLVFTLIQLVQKKVTQTSICQPTRPVLHKGPTFCDPPIACSEHWLAPSWYLSVVKPPWIMRCMQTMLRRKKRMHQHRNVKGNLPILMRMISGSITSWPANNAQWFIVYYHSRHDPNNSIAIHFIKISYRSWVSRFRRDGCYLRIYFWNDDKRGF